MTQNYARSRQEDGQMMLAAAVALINRSSLLRWDGVGGFVKVERDIFDQAWQEVDPVFGRTVLWNMFSVGAEMLLKGVLLCNGRDKVRKEPKEVLRYPGASDIRMWATQVASDQGPKDDAPDYGTLRDLVGSNRRKTTEKPLASFLVDRHAMDDEADLIWSVYALLGSAIRNRDAHAYVPNVRDAHFDLADTLFRPAFNLLLAWLPLGGKTLAAYLDEGRRLVDTAGAAVTSAPGHPP
jgi:hypothetical protein